MPERLWWERVPAGTKMLAEISRTLREGRCVLLDSDRVFRPAALRMYVQQAMAEVEYGAHWLTISAAGCRNAQQVTSYLMGSIGMTDDYAINQQRLEALRGTHAFVWVNGILPDTRDAWLKLASELMRRKSRLRLILDMPLQDREIEGCDAISSECSRFDIYYFAIMQLSGMTIRDSEIEYAATLCTELAEGDPQRCAQLCGKAVALLHDPEEVCRQVLPDADVKRCICRAQTRVFLPMVDVCRVMAIELYEAELNKLLPFTDDQNNEVKDIGSVELRHIVHYANRIRLDDEIRVLLDSQRKVRNDVAHLKPLSYEEIGQFLIRVRTMELYHARAMHRAE